MLSNRLKVGQLAKRTGLTVRTLHHYEDVGLLTPSARTESGHRLYGTREVIRLQQIVSLRQVQEEWTALIARVRAEMEKGTDPASETAQRLGEQWMRLVQAFTGGDIETQKSLKRMYEQEGPEKASHNMLDTAVQDYVSRIMAAGESST